MNRNLDSVYFRVKRDGKFDNICFSDLTEQEQDEVLKGRSAEWLASLCKILAGRIKRIGDELDLVAVDKEDERI